MKDKDSRRDRGSPKIFHQGVHVGRLFLRVEHRGRKRIETF